MMIKSIVVIALIVVAIACFGIGALAGADAEGRGGPMLAKMWCAAIMFLGAAALTAKLWIVP